MQALSAGQAFVPGFSARRPLPHLFTPPLSGAFFAPLPHIVSLYQEKGGQAGKGLSCSRTHVKILKERTDTVVHTARIFWQKT